MNYFDSNFHVIRLLSSDSSPPSSSNSECLWICYVISLKMHASIEMEVPGHVHAPPSNCNEYCREFQICVSNNDAYHNANVLTYLFSVFFQIQPTKIYNSEEYLSDSYTTSFSLSASY